MQRALGLVMLVAAALGWYQFLTPTSGGSAVPERAYRSTKHVGALVALTIGGLKFLTA